VNHRFEHSVGFAGLLLTLATVSYTVTAQVVPIPNHSFENVVETAPVGWSLSSGRGYVTSDCAADGQKALLVAGTGQDTNYWRTPDLPLEPSSVYALHFSARRFGRKSQGTPISGPVFCNVDHAWLGRDWQDFRDVFMTPASIRENRAWLRFGQWHEEQPVAFDAVRLVKVQPVYCRFGTIHLGEGEVIDGNSYVFRTPWEQTLSNHCRTMYDHDCHFNTIRTVYGKSNYTTFRFQLGERRQLAAHCDIGLFYHFSGRLVVEAGNDGLNWKTLGHLDAESTNARFSIPDMLLPADTVWLRLRAEADRPLGPDSDMGALAVSYVEYRAEIDGEPLTAVGQTRCVEITEIDPRFDVYIRDIGPVIPHEANSIDLEIVNRTDTRARVRASALVQRDSGRTTRTRTRLVLKPGSNTVSLPYRVNDTGSLNLQVRAGEFRACMPVFVAHLYACSYGKRLPCSTEDVVLWEASSGWKVWKDRPPPKQAGRTLTVQAARNETEAVQLVVSPRVLLKGVRIEPGALTGPDGASVPADAIDVLNVEYVHIQMPTDYTGSADYWPDPLSPIDGPIDLDADENHPFWIRISVPQGTPPGDYRGHVAISSEGYTAAVPLEVQVYDFELPDRMTCETAFGFSPHRAFAYHGARTREQQIELLDKYFQSFADHHISPYDPAALREFTVEWPDVRPGEDVDPETLVARFNWSEWDRAMRKAIDHYHFNTFRIPLQGMGGGSFKSRREPVLLGFGADTPEYKALFGSYCRQLEEHLRENGWFDEGFVYWFDEPDVRDYPFVTKGFERLKHHAPGLRRMLTEQIEPELIGGPNLWCPNTVNYQDDLADERRKHGDQFWWYVCTGPKAPYTTLFIDHAGTEMRVWLWQTWKRRIDGILVWQTNYWTSDAAYPGPDNLQNPYADPMSWQAGSTSASMKSPWGNGDGRFLYPPKAGADGRPARPLITGPVESIRWEMLRDGIEDYEYFVMLERLLQQKSSVLSQRQRRKYRQLLDVPQQVTSSMTTFATDPAPLERHRHRLALAIEELQSKVIPASRVSRSNKSGT
jgi:hypothetical protein